MDDFHPDTWAFRAGIVGESVANQYVVSLYWSFQTFTSVGYGDITPATETERIICTFWPFVSVAVYSFLIGNVAVLIAHFDLRTKNLQV